MAMLRHRAAWARPCPRRSSTRRGRTATSSTARSSTASPQDDESLRVAYTLTREQPPGWTGYDRRIDGEMLAEVFGSPDPAATAFVCGPTRFVEVAADGLVGLGYEAGRVRTERFGPSGR